MDWKRKLTSRKFWSSVINFVTMLIIAFNGSQELATKVTAIILAGAGVVAYIIGEGLADAAAVEQTYVIPESGPTFGPMLEEGDDGNS